MFANLNTGMIQVSLPFEQALELAREAGFGGIDPPVGQLVEGPSPEEVRDQIAEAGLRVGGMGLPVEFRKDEKTYEDGLARLPELARLASELGCERCATFIMPGHDELAYPQNFDLHVARLQPVAKILHEHGIRFGVEFVGPRSLRAQFAHAFVHTIDQILELADAIGSNTGVLLDTFHWYTIGASETDIAQKLRNRITLVHVNDARPDRTPHEQLDRERELPGETGVIDLAAFMRALRQTDYDGPLTVEPMKCPSLEGLDDQAKIRKTGESVLAMLEL